MDPDTSKSIPLPGADRPELVMIHALLYSIFAERKAILAERLRWRERRNTPAVLENQEELKQHLLLLKQKSKELCARKKALETEQAQLMRNSLILRTANEQLDTGV